MLAHGKCKVPTADTGANITVSIIKQLNALCSSTDSPIILVPTKKRSHFGDPPNEHHSHWHHASDGISKTEPVRVPRIPE